jgi:hypothetical protein
MATSKVVNVSSKAVKAISNDISVSLQRLVAAGYLTQAESKTLRAALGPAGNYQAVLKAMQTVSANSSPLMQSIRSLTIGLDLPGGSSDSGGENQAARFREIGGDIGSLVGSGVGYFISKTPAGGLLGGAVGKAVGELVGAGVDELAGEGGDTPEGDDHTPDDSGDTGQPSGRAGL